MGVARPAPYSPVMKTVIGIGVLLFSALSSAASPIIGSGSFTAFGSNPDRDGTPFWDQTSHDGQNCGAGYFLAGGFGPCSSMKNGTPSGGLNLGATNLEYYSAGGNIVPYSLQAGFYSFRLEGRIAGSNTFQVGYRFGGVDTDLFTQANTAGDVAAFTALGPVTLYIKDGSNLFRSLDSMQPSTAAFRDIKSGRYYFGFEDRSGGDSDYNDVVISTTFQPVPEPGTLGLMGAALAAAVFARLRRR